MNATEQLQSLKLTGPLRLTMQKRVVKLRKPIMVSSGLVSELQHYFVLAQCGEAKGQGVATPLPWLSPEYHQAEKLLHKACLTVEKTGILAPDTLQHAPSLRFAIEGALLTLKHGVKPIWDTPYARGEAGLSIHHLLWMSEPKEILRQAQQGIAAGFRVLKMKVGALPWAEEVALLRELRQNYPQAELRVDANGAFKENELNNKLYELANIGVHSIEQPLRPKSSKQLARIIAESPLLISLDEELISINTPAARHQFMDEVQPRALCIKPSMHGGLVGAEAWLQLAAINHTEITINSALEPHLGLHLLAEWTAAHLPHSISGLSKGKLYMNDAPLPTQLCGAELRWCRDTFQD